MSIITDALKKAEEERELKAKQASQEASVALIEELRPSLETVVLEKPEVDEIDTENIVPLQPVNFVSRKPNWLSGLQFKEVLILGGIAILVFLVLFLLPKWPTLGSNFSLRWRPAQGGSVFQVGTVKQAVLHGRDNRLINLPFQLSGISVAGDNRYALINGTIVQKGDSIDGTFVKEILDQEVILETRAGEIKLKISTH